MAYFQHSKKAQGYRLPTGKTPSNFADNSGNNDLGSKTIPAKSMYKASPTRAIYCVVTGIRSPTVSCQLKPN
jgi:hypothetical protein